MSDGFFRTLLDFCSGKTVALIQAYFDESERSDGLLVVAGYAFTPGNALKLTRDFNELFGKYGGLHMKELLPRRGRFKGISNGEKDRLLKGAVDIVRKRFAYGFSVSLNIHEFERHATKNVRGFGAAYPFCCYLAMFALLSVARKHGDVTPVHYIFEAGHPLQPAAEYMVGIAAQPQLQAFFHYSGHSFLPKSDATPLQAADMLAWEAGKFKTETLDRQERQIRGSLLALFAADPKRYSVHHLEGVKLERHLKLIRSAIREQLLAEAALEGIERRVRTWKRQNEKNTRIGQI